MQITFYTNIDFDRNYEHVMRFANQTLKDEYFGDRVYNGLENLNIRDINIGYEDIVVDIPYNDMAKVKYFSIDNNGKKYYCWVDEIKPYSPEQSTIIYSIDYMMTYEFEYSLETSYVDREHQDRWSNTSTRIFSTTDENVGYGRDYKLVKQKVLRSNLQQSIADNYAGEIYFVEFDFVGSPFPFTTTYNTLPSVLQTAIVPIYVPKTNVTYTLQINGTAVDDLPTLLSNYAGMPEIFKISVIPYVPFNINMTISGTTINLTTNAAYVEAMNSGGHNCPCFIQPSSNIGALNTLTTSEIASYKSITPSYTAARDIDLESKLFTNPYYFYKFCYQDNEGVVYAERMKKQYEYDIKCKVSGSSINKMKLFVNDYNNDISNYLQPNEYLNVVLDNELAQNKDEWLEFERNNRATIRNGALIKLGSAATGIVLGAMTGGIGLAVAGTSVIGTATSILQDQIKYADIQQRPDTIKNTGGDTPFWWADKQILARFETYQIQDAPRQKLYDYFYSFGYKCGDVKKPTLDSRYYFNFIKTIGANIKTNTIYGEQIKAVFDKGVTFWHYRNKSTFKGVYNYGYENIEMSLI